ncbi:MAG: VanZ family protein [Terriglobia bacterium]
MNNSSTRRARPWDFSSLLWWFTTLGWAGLIFYLSTGTFGGEFTTWLLRTILNLIGVNISADQFATLHFLVRKLAHLTEYAMFSLLLYGGLSGGKQFAWRARTGWRCVAIAAAYSLTDELHQSFVPGRGASLVDCSIDTAGAALAMLFLYASSRISQTRARRTAAKNDSPAET